MNKKILIPIVLCTLLSSCGLYGAFEADRMKNKYRQECFGDQSVSCRNMMVDVLIAELEFKKDELESFKEKIESCYGKEGFEQLIVLMEKKIEHYDDIRPNIFMRIFLSGAQIEFNPPPFPLENEIVELFSRKCIKADNSDANINKSADKKEELKPQGGNSSTVENANVGQDANINKCVDEFVVAYRTEIGNEAIVRAEQLQEWEDWCKTGKRAGN
ncbi:hypothetical protein [uncultured Deefgea sp.]|uniref:hypothetical protein n=1 Tax=uncultured Deefgea sp. TaxID=1304914 RepID=UPI0025996A59|nr:hypothetical protein [uncultured Deefgea sp.]